MAGNEADTPLGREYARLADWRTAAPEHDRFTGRQAFTADELAIWTAPVGSKRLVGPPDHWPNPVVVGEVVIAVAFSPGCLFALDRGTGRPVWSRPLGYLGHPVVPGPPGSGLVYAGTSQELLAVEAATGRIVWTFCPYGRQGESIYSRPAVADGRLFIGDRRGYLHCRDAATGEPVWRVLTSRADNNDVNSDPVVSGGVVAVGTNAGLAAGYDTATGRPVWRHRTDGPCIRVAPAGQSTALFWAGGRLELLAVATGDRHGRWQRRHHAVDVACAAGDVVLVTTRRVWGRERHLWPVAELRAYRGDHELYAQTYPRWCGPALRYEPATRRVYEAGPRGIGVLDPRTGERDAVVTFPGDRPSDRVSPPWAQDGRLYVAVDDGRVMALRHP